MKTRLCGAMLAAAVLVPATATPSSAAGGPPRVDARAWALIDARTGDVLVSHAARHALPIASTTKLMTAYVALRELRLRRIVRAAPYSPTYGESLLGLRPGQRISVRDLLYGLILRSGNDAAYDLARAAAGSEGRFVHQMNAYAAALGLTRTHYANPIGLDQRGNYSSALDLATLTRRLLQIPVFARIAASRNAELRSVHPRRRIATLNELLRMAPWVTGVKTGHTFGARYVLVGSGRRRGVALIAVVIGTPTDEERFEDTLRLLEYGFSLYRRHVPVRAGEELADPSIRYAGGRLPLRAARAVAIGVRHGDRLSVSVRAPHEVAGPIPRGSRLGRAVVLVNGLRVGRVPLLASRHVPKAGAFDRLRTLLGGTGMLVALALFVILIAAVLLWRLMRQGVREHEMVSRDERQAVRHPRREGGAAK
ncbi:MAG: D-alanyl-D-alanine carboxypeptidase family protein [Solirubrobacterales bacterium]